jgi:hypothetical protein
MNAVKWGTLLRAVCGVQMIGEIINNFGELCLHESGTCRLETLNYGEKVDIDEEPAEQSTPWIESIFRNLLEFILMFRLMQ